MTELAFEVIDVQPQRYVAAPHLLFRIRATEGSGARVHAIALRCQIRIEPQRRPYIAEEREGLGDLFGTPDRYATTLKPFLWTHATAMVQGFEFVTEFDLPVACTYDFEVSGSKYLQALRGGTVPLVLLFSGTVFTRGANGFAAEQLSWSLEAPCQLPVSAWRELMELHFPGSSWIRIERATLDALVREKSSRGLTSWDQTITELIESREDSVWAT
jgi:hypothetical protein